MDKIRKKKPFYKKYIFVLVCLAVFLSFGLYQLFFRDNRTALKVDASKIEISTVNNSEFQEYIPIQGKVLPVNVVYLDAIEGGRVEQKYLDAGAWVEKGDTILRLSNTNLVLNMMQREAEYFSMRDQLEAERMALEQMRINYDSKLADLKYQLKGQTRKYQQDSTLHSRSVVSFDEYLKSKDCYEYSLEQLQLLEKHFKEEKTLRENQIKISDAFLQRMKKNLELINEKIEALTIVAPIKGQLNSLDAEVGESKTMGQRIGQINSLDELKILADIDEHYIRRVHNDSKGEFALDRSNYTVVIHKILPDVKDGRFQAELKFEGTIPGNILMGQTIYIKLQIGAEAKKNALTLSKGGFYQSTAGQWVYVLSKDGKSAEKRVVKIGKQNTDMFEVLFGLDAGEKVITSGYESFDEKDVLILGY